MVQDRTEPAENTGMRKFLFASAIFLAVMSGWVFGRKSERDRFIAEAAASPLPTAPVPASARGCSIWFIGSSSIANWDTMPQDMAPWEARNRGIGGATMREITQRFKNEPDSVKPAAIVFYAGENDIAFGGSVDRTMADLEAFIAAKRARYGQLRVLILSVKPSPTRWDEHQSQIEYNRRAQAFATDQPDLEFLDIASMLLVRDRPGPYYRDDGIHLNAEGYRLWAHAIDRALPALVPDAAQRCAVPVKQG